MKNQIDMSRLGSRSVLVASTERGLSPLPRNSMRSRFTEKPDVSTASAASSPSITNPVISAGSAPSWARPGSPPSISVATRFISMIAPSRPTKTTACSVSAIRLCLVCLSRCWSSPSSSDAMI
ncbi:hypothetical protein D3C71_1739190 [compost metagenome]